MLRAKAQDQPISSPRDFLISKPPLTLRICPCRLWSSRSRQYILHENAFVKPILRPKTSDRTSQKPFPGTTGVFESPQHPFTLCARDHEDLDQLLRQDSWLSSDKRRDTSAFLEVLSGLSDPCRLSSPGPAQSTSCGSAERAGAFPHPGPASGSFASHGARSDRLSGSASSGRWPGCAATRSGDRTGA